MTERDIDRHVIEKLKEIYGFTIPDVEIWLNVRDFQYAKNGKESVIVVMYGFSPILLIIPKYPVPEEEMQF